MAGRGVGKLYSREKRKDFRHALIGVYWHGGAGGGVMKSGALDVIWLSVRSHLSCKGKGVVAK